ncbi:MAG: tRNA lysidine(34) synthetase TilS [Acidobacteriota bacterium]
MNPIAVAYSGGRDSTALLYATALAARAHDACPVIALHVHHGISEQADDWLVHAQQQCAAWAAQGLPVQLVHRRLSLTLCAGDSVEAVAREARYAALADMAKQAGADCVLLAHHRQDQAETFLLQAMRGAGVAGLSGMPGEVAREGLIWYRPWLNRDRAEIEAYVRLHGLAYIDDDTNQDQRYARNRLRLAVMPTLRAEFPHVDRALAQSAQHSADANWCLQQWARRELAELVVPDSDGRALKAGPLLARPGAERREILRHWFVQLTGRALSKTWVDRLDAELSAGASPDRQAHWPDVALGLYRGELSWHGDSLQHARAGVASVRDDEVVCIGGPGSYPLPHWGGVLHVQEAGPDELGVSWSCLAELRVRARTGGENFQIAANRPARILRKQFQALGVPAWLRDAPLFYAQDQLVLVPALGMDARISTVSAQSRARLTWLSLPAGGVTG